MEIIERVFHITSRSLSLFHAPTLIDMLACILFLYTFLQTTPSLNLMLQNMHNKSPPAEEPTNPSPKPKLSLDMSFVHSVNSLRLDSPPPPPPTLTTSSKQQLPRAHSTTTLCSSSKSILKKSSLSITRKNAKKRIHFDVKSPIVYCLTPIENPEEYYGIAKLDEQQ